MLLLLIDSQSLQMKIRKDNGVPLCKNKSKQSLFAKWTSGKEGEQVAVKVPADNNMFIFHPKQYPFNHHSLTPQNSYKTIVSARITKEQIQKIASLDNPALVQILKIGKGYQKLSGDTLDQLSYSFYYEVVPYSLKKLALLHDYSTQIMRKLFTINLKNVLLKLSDYLITQKIDYSFNLDDIGVTNNGDIKIYISPLVVCGSNQKVDRNIIKKSINKIVNWWQITLSIYQSKARVPTGTDLAQMDNLNADYIDKEVSQLIQDEESESEHTVERQLAKKNTANIKNSYRLQNSISSYRGQHQKIHQMDQHIKQIRSKLIEKAKLYQSSQRPKHYKTISESSKFENKPKIQRNKLNDSSGMQKMHQNINCINIYTQNKQRPQFHKIKRMATQPIFSFKVGPQNQKGVSKQQSCSKLFAQFDYYCDSEEDLSADTYQMQLQYQKQTPSLSLQQSGSFVQPFKDKKGQRNLQRQGTINIKDKVTSKYASGSAGPLQFKTFLINVIEPQINTKQHNLNGQSILQEETDRNRSSSLIDKGKEQLIEVEQFNKINRFSSISSFNQFNRMKSLPRGVNKQMNIQKISEGITARQQSKMVSTKMSQLVKVALQKSKKAIALLSRVNKGKSPLKG